MGENSPNLVTLVIAYVRKYICIAQFVLKMHSLKTLICFWIHFIKSWKQGGVLRERGRQKKLFGQIPKRGGNRLTGRYVVFVQDTIPITWIKYCCDFVNELSNTFPRLRFELREFQNSTFFLRPFDVGLYLPAREIGGKFTGKLNWTYKNQKCLVLV
jgi:hypothetical protein